MPEKANHSPRISFSHDFLHSDSIPIEQSPLQSPSDFHFSIPGDVVSGENSLSAEEFFLDGKILPTELIKRTEPETNPIRNVKPVHEIEEVAVVMDTKPTPLSFLNSSEPGRTKEELNPIRNDKPAHEIELEKKLDTASFLWFNGNSLEDCEIGIGLPLLNRKKSKKFLQVWSSSSSSSSNSSCEKKKKKNYGGEISVDSILDVFPSWSMFGLGLIYIGTGGNKNRSMLFDW